MRALLFLVALPLALLGCGAAASDTSGPAAPPSEDAVELAADLSGTRWESVGVTGYALPEGATVRLEFDGDHFLAQIDCNHIAVPYTIDDQRLIVVYESTTATLMACPRPQADADAWFLSLVTSQPEIEMDGDTLTISGAGSMVTFAASNGSAAEPSPAESAAVPDSERAEDVLALRAHLADRPGEFDDDEVARINEFAEVVVFADGLVVAGDRSLVPPDPELGQRFMTIQLTDEEVQEVRATLGAADLADISSPYEGLEGYVEDSLTTVIHSDMLGVTIRAYGLGSFSDPAEDDGPPGTSGYDELRMNAPGLQSVNVMLHDLLVRANDEGAPYDGDRALPRTADLVDAGVQQPPQSEVEPPASSPVVAIPTCEEFCGEDALAYGVLASDGEGCVWFEAGDPRIAQDVVWPRGFAARFTAAGVELIGPDGEVVAREGDTLEMGGGGYDRAEPSCAPGADRGRVWFARTAAVIDQLPK